MFYVKIWKNDNVKVFGMYNNIKKKKKNSRKLTKRVFN